MIQVSCAGMARIMDRRGRYILAVNKRNREEGRTVLSPIGGGLEGMEEGLSFLESLGAVPLEKAEDLRFKIGTDQVPEVVSWFEKRVDRELSPFRELQEELVEEMKAFPMLGEEQLSIRFLGFSIRQDKTTYFSPGVQKKTIHLVEIFEVALPPSHLAKLIGHPDIHVVTAKEILKGVTRDGIEIAGITRTILDPLPTLSVKVKV